MIPFRSAYLDTPAVRGRAVDLFEPETSSRGHALFLVHGGGWKAGSRGDMHTIALAFRERGFEVASTDYRLAGVTAFEQIADVRDSLRAFAEDLRRRGKTRKIVLYGSSAGAHLALMTALLADPAPPVRAAGVCVQAAPFLFEPWEDIFPAIWDSMQTIAGVPHAQDPERYRRLAPMEYVTPSMPPVFALHAENEHMFPLDQAEEFARRATACGARVQYKVYPRTEHGFFYNLERWQQREAFEDIVDFVESL